MSILKEWITALCAAGVVGALADILVPRGKIKKTLKVMLSLLMACCLAMPLSEMILGKSTYGEVFYENTSEVYNEGDIEKSITAALEKAVAARLETLLQEKISADIKVYKIYTLKDGGGNINVTEVVVCAAGKHGEITKLVREELGRKVTLTWE